MSTKLIKQTIFGLTALLFLGQSKAQLSGSYNVPATYASIAKATAANLNLRNNIFINNSAPSGTGIAWPIGEVPPL